MTTKLPLSRFTGSSTPARPVFPRQSAVQEPLHLPEDEAPQPSPSFQLESLFGEPSGTSPAASAPHASPARARSQGRAQELPVRGGIAPRVSAPRSGVYNANLSVGQQFLHARLARGWTIEDVAFQTHIAHTLLRDMENDDLSNFANLTYAKGFLKLYSRHLGLDLSDYLEQFDTSAISEVTGHEYVQTANLVRSLSAPAIAPDAVSNPRARLLGIGLLTGVAAIVLFVFLKFSHGSGDAPPPSQSNRAPSQAETSSGRISETRRQSANAASRSAITPAGAENAPPRAEVIQEEIATRSTGL